MSGSQNCQPGGAGGQCGSGAHPGAGRHPAGGSGQPGGVLNRHPDATGGTVRSVSIPGPVLSVNPEDREVILVSLRALPVGPTRCVIHLNRCNQPGCVLKSCGRIDCSGNGRVMRRPNRQDCSGPGWASPSPVLRRQMGLVRVCVCARRVRSGVGCAQRNPRKFWAPGPPLAEWGC